MPLISWDVRIAGEPYVFPRDSKGGLLGGIQLGRVGAEPAPSGKIDSIIVDSLHGGLGGPIDRSLQRYRSTVNADLVVPGIFTADTKDPVLLEAVAVETPVFYRPKFLPFHQAAVRVLYTTGRNLRYFDPTTSTPTSTAVGGDSVLAADSGSMVYRYTGSAIMYGTDLVVFVENMGTSGSAFVNARQASHRVIVNSALSASIATTDHGSFGAKVGTFYSYIDANGASASQVYANTYDAGDSWEPNNFLGSAAEQITMFNDITGGIHGLAQLIAPMSVPKPTWAVPLADKAVVYFFEDGNVFVIERGQLVIAGFPPNSAAHDDVAFTIGDREANSKEWEYSWNALATTSLPQVANQAFGRGACRFLDAIVFPAGHSLLALNPASGDIRDISPNINQTEQVEALRGEILAVGAFGSSLFVAKRRADDSTKTEILRYVQEADRLAVHPCVGATAAGEIICDLLPFWDDSGYLRLFYLVLDTTNNQVDLREKKLRLQSGAATWTLALLPDLASVTTAKYSGPAAAASMTKLFLGIRGYLENPDGGGKLSFADVVVEGQEVYADEVTDDGTFQRPLYTAGEDSQSYAIGRDIALTLQLENTSGMNHRALHFPLSIDFMWVPDDADRVTLSLAIDDDARDGARARADALLALSKTVTLIEFPQGTQGITEWTVFVEDVAVEPAIEDIGGMGQPVYIGKLVCRRLS